MDIRKKQKAVIDALEDVKAKDIEAFEVKHITPEFDRVIIATGDSTRQVKSLARSVHDRMRKLGERVHGLEGEGEGEWVLVDLGDIIVHVMHPAIRAYYNLEELWGQPKVDGKPTPVSGPARKSAGPKSVARKSAARKSAAPGAVSTEHASADPATSKRAPRKRATASPVPRKRAAAKKSASTAASAPRPASAKRVTAGTSTRKRSSPTGD